MDGVEWVKDIFSYAGPGVGMGFFMGWYFVSKKYMDYCIEIINKNTEAMTKLTVIIEGMKNE